MNRKQNTVRKASRAKASIKRTAKPSKGRFTHFLEGMANIFPVSSRDYVHPTGGGFSKDAAAIRNDFGTIALDLDKALCKYEQTQSN
ncbi:hypothetical protein [Methylomonas sp. AM2-LC]|uniref:hypothetical protein n=1 Tax=Methylomonas sp. AM2-LC TaxID=3153301 RepID=UPI0032656875